MRTGGSVVGVLCGRKMQYQGAKCQVYWVFERHKCKSCLSAGRLMV